MAEHIEVETRELQEKIEEAREEAGGWVRFVGLSTAILAVFAAVSALQSGSLANEATIHQIRASDTWAEYQASRQKDHAYTIALNGIVDANAGNPAFAAALRSAATPPRAAGAATAGSLVAESPATRALDYRGKIAQEASKERGRSAEAARLERDASEELRRQHAFEFAVALMQVAIALGAVAALARLRAAWYTSMAVGCAGIALFAMGFL